MGTDKRAHGQSCMRGISHWEPFATEHGLPLLIPNGDPNRGGIVASFAISLARKKLAYGTIQGYVWGWEQHHINNGYHTPLDNVQDWAKWMHSLEVQIYTPSEPTEMVPFLLLTRSLQQVDHTQFWMVRTACAMLMLFYTMSRSEYPVPKTHDGQHNFDVDQHCRQCDVRVSNGYVEFAFGKIKQDKLGKRLPRRSSRMETYRPSFRHLEHARKQADAQRVLDLEACG